MRSIVPLVPHTKLINIVECRNAIGQMPTLELDGKTFHQSKAILEIDATVNNIENRRLGEPAEPCEHLNDIPNKTDKTDTISAHLQRPDLFVLYTRSWRDFSGRRLLILRIQTAVAEERNEYVLKQFEGQGKKNGIEINQEQN